jgi:uncharacterized protein
MRNIIGSPVEGEDFFDRPGILANLRRELDAQANILLVAPRRVGKTSLVLRLCETWNSRRQQKAVFLNVEGQGDEFAFAEKLVDELANAQLHPQRFARATQAFRKFRQGLGGAGIKVPGLELSLGDASDAEHSTLRKALESVFRDIEEGDDHILIAVDELPEFLLTLQKAEHGPARVTAILHWLRELRQTFRKRIRWVFLGSIGLDNFVQDQKLHKLINDLQVFTLEAFSAEEADAFLIELGESNGLALDQAEREDIIRRVGWPLPYHLHLVFHELRDTEPRSISRAFDALLEPQKLSYFDTWHERIEVQFSTSEAAACKAILGHLCKYPTGRKHDQLLAVLMARPSADVESVREQLSRLLIALQRDGYLQATRARYAFRSFLLREYWRRRHGK